MTSLLSSDFTVKEYIKTMSLKMDYRTEDVGTYSKESVDYPDYAQKVALRVRENIILPL